MLSDSGSSGSGFPLCPSGYALGYIVTHEEIQDNLYLEVNKTRASSNARAFRQTKDGWQRISITGHSVRRPYLAPMVWPGSTAHPNTSGGTYQNKPTIDADLSETSWKTSSSWMMQATDDRGLLINLMPKSLHIAPQNWFNANRILHSVYQAGNANNDINVLRATGAFPAVSSSTITSPHRKPGSFVPISSEARHGLPAAWPISFDQDKDF